MPSETRLYNPQQNVFPSPPPSTYKLSTGTPLTGVWGMRGWWWRVTTPEERGGIWRTSRGSLEQVLPWCPEVLAWLVGLDHNGSPCSEYFTTRVDDHVATLSSGCPLEFQGWEQFPAVDLWQCLAFKEQLSKIVRGQAQSLPRIDFRAIAGSRMPSHPATQ